MSAANTLRQRALAHLSRREHSRAELEAKLQRTPAAEEQPGAIAALLDTLAANGLQSDQRTADSLVRTKGAQLGRRGLQHLLRARGIEPELCRQSLDTLESSEQARAHALWLRRFGGAAADAAGRARQARFLMSRGFDADIVRKIVHGSADDGAG